MKKILLFGALLISCAILSAQTKLLPSSIRVALDGTGDYKSIQEAINSVRDLNSNQVIIKIGNGVYHEKIVIPSWKTNITLSGESKDRTIITNSDYTGKDYPTKDTSGKNKFMTFTSYTVLIEGNDCSIENLTIENKAGRVGQAVALHVEGDRTIIKDCKLLGNQDTLYAAKENSRQYYIDCLIHGTTDYIFGEAIAVFQNCEIRSLSNSFITAASTRKDQKFGFVFIDCMLTADTGVTKVYLGRPWRPYAKTVFIRTKLGKHILPEGWDAWKGDAMFPDKEKTAYYAEYQSAEEGANVSFRVKWSHQINKKQAKTYSLKNIFGSWNPLAIR